MANVCACGCGELLPEGSTRSFKRGHKARLDNPDAVTSEEGMAFADDSPGEEPLTLEGAARITPDDAPPKEEREYKAKTAVKVTAAIRKDIEGKLAFALGMSAQVWLMADPVCGSAMLDHTPEIAKKLTPVVCQSPEVVRWLTKSGNFLIWVDLFMACWPVLQIVFAHHIAKTITVSVPNVNGHPVNTNDYVVQ